MFKSFKLFKNFQKKAKHIDKIKTLPGPAMPSQDSLNLLKQLKILNKTKTFFKQSVVSKSSQKAKLVELFDIRERKLNLQ